MVQSRSPLTHVTESDLNLSFFLCKAETTLIGLGGLSEKMLIKSVPSTEEVQDSVIQSSDTESSEEEDLQR